jgi:hypothetical protein
MATAGTDTSRKLKTSRTSEKVQVGSSAYATFKRGASARRANGRATAHAAIAHSSAA